MESGKNHEEREENSMATSKLLEEPIVREAVSLTRWLAESGTVASEGPLL